MKRLVVICGVDRSDHEELDRRAAGVAQSDFGFAVTLHFGQDPFRPENTRQFCVLSLMQSCSLQKGTRDSPKPCCKMLI